MSFGKPKKIKLHRDKLTAKDYMARYESRGQPKDLDLSKIDLELAAKMIYVNINPEKVINSNIDNEIKKAIIYGMNSDIDSNDDVENTFSLYDLGIKINSTAELIVIAERLNLSIYDIYLRQVYSGYFYTSKQTLFPI